MKHSKIEVSIEDFSQAADIQKIIATKEQLEKSNKSLGKFFTEHIKQDNYLSGLRNNQEIKHFCKQSIARINSDMCLALEDSQKSKGKKSKKANNQNIKGKEIQLEDPQQKPSQQELDKYQKLCEYLEIEEQINRCALKLKALKIIEHLDEFNGTPKKISTKDVIDFLSQIQAYYKKNDPESDTQFNERIMQYLVATFLDKAFRENIDINDKNISQIFSNEISVKESPKKTYRFKINEEAIKAVSLIIKLALEPEFHPNNVQDTIDEFVDKNARSLMHFLSKCIDPKTRSWSVKHLLFVKSQEQMPRPYCAIFKKVENKVSVEYTKKDFWQPGKSNVTVKIFKYSIDGRLEEEPNIDQIIELDPRYYQHQILIELLREIGKLLAKFLLPEGEIMPSINAVDKYLDSHHEIPEVPISIFFRSSNMKHGAKPTIDYLEDQRKIIDEFEKCLPHMGERALYLILLEIYQKNKKIFQTILEKMLAIKIKVDNAKNTWQDDDIFQILEALAWKTIADKEGKLKNLIADLIDACLQIPVESEIKKLLENTIIGALENQEPQDDLGQIASRINVLKDIDIKNMAFGFKDNVNKVLRYAITAQSMTLESKGEGIQIELKIENKLELKHHDTLRLESMEFNYQDYNLHSDKIEIKTQEQHVEQDDMSAALKQRSWDDIEANKLLAKQFKDIEATLQKQQSYYPSGHLITSYHDDLRDLMEYGASVNEIEAGGEVKQIFDKN